MKISQLPPGLKELAEKRREENTSKRHYRSSDFLDSAFQWVSTPEGYNFWVVISRGNFTPYYNCKIVNLKKR